jgi:hypothetical protein
VKALSSSPSNENEQTKYYNKCTNSIKFKNNKGVA